MATVIVLFIKDRLYNSKIILKNYFHHSADHDGIVVHISGEHSDVVVRSNIVDHSRIDHGSLDICVRSWGRHP